mgnify:CR=1 FL=1
MGDFIFISDLDLERLEEKYLNIIYNQLYININPVIKGIMSRDKITIYWKEKFANQSEQKITSDIAKGAERIFSHYMVEEWEPNSCPIGSDLFYKTNNAYVHIEIKTARVNSRTQDYKGLCPVSKNQTSYCATESYTKRTMIKTIPNLPYSYFEYPCLTYAIQTIYDPDNNYSTLAVLLISIPNGQLFNIYGNNIAKAGKLKNESFRYVYSRNPYFEKIKKCTPCSPHRVKFIYFNEGYILDNESPITKEFITGRNDIL